MLSVHANCCWLLLTEMSIHSKALNYFVFLSRAFLSSLGKQRGSCLSWRRDICFWHTFTFYDNTVLQPDPHCLIIASSHLPSLPPFLDFSQLKRLLLKLQYVVWFGSALSEKLAMAKYRKFYLAPEITWYWLAKRHQASGYHHALCKSMSESSVWNAAISRVELNTFTRGILWMTLSIISLPEIACSLPRGCLVMWKYNNIKVAVTRFAHTFLHTPKQQLLMSQQVVLICPLNISQCRCTLYACICHLSCHRTWHRRAWWMSPRGGHYDVISPH